MTMRSFQVVWFLQPTLFCPSLWSYSTTITSTPTYNLSSNTITLSKTNIIIHVLMKNENNIYLLHHLCPYFSHYLSTLIMVQDTSGQSFQLSFLFPMLQPAFLVCFQYILHIDIYLSTCILQMHTHVRTYHNPDILFSAHTYVSSFYLLGSILIYLLNNKDVASLSTSSRCTFPCMHSFTNVNTIN